MDTQPSIVEAAATGLDIPIPSDSSTGKTPRNTTTVRPLPVRKPQSAGFAGRRIQQMADLRATNEQHHTIVYRQIARLLAAYGSRPLVTARSAFTVFIAGFLLALSYVDAQASSRGDISLTVIGPPEVVFNYTTQACESIDITDFPARAFRDSAGVVNLVASHYVSRRAIGPTLNTVVHQCNPIYNSHDDVSQLDYRYHEWITSTYTMDGQVVYAIIHNEWYAMLVDANCTEEIPGEVSGLTLAVSTDRGATFIQPAHYLVRYPTTLWNNSYPCSPADYTIYGDFGATNIIRKDGFYYLFFMYIMDPNEPIPDAQFACLMRTNNLAAASSWETWNGSGYTNFPTAPCQPIAVGNAGNVASLTYNTYLQKYVAVSPSPENGSFFFQVSDDLFKWSKPKNIIGIDSTLGALAYPSLLDPEDLSRNFETPGQQPYLYFTRFNDGVGGLNRDLLRVPVQFDHSGRSLAGIK
jgi:hypothetical protein